MRHNKNVYFDDNKNYFLQVNMRPASYCLRNWKPKINFEN